MEDKDSKATDDTKPEETTDAETPVAGEDEPDTPDAVEESPADAPAGDAGTETPARQRSGGSGGIAWLALFLALIGVAAVGYSIVDEWRTSRAAEAGTSDLRDSIAGLRSRIGDADTTIAALERALADSTDANARLAAELDGLRRETEQRLALIDSLSPRMTGIENSVAALQGVSAGARNTWLLAEAEYYMQIANAQLQLAGNPELALLALGMADERIVQLADPGLIDVRRALSNELAALEAMEQPDTEGIALTLASLARVVDSLPLRQAAAGDEAADETSAEEEGGFDRFWGSVTGAFSELVKVTPPDQARAPLIAPEAEYFLRTNLSLKLQAARLALLRGQQTIFEQSLDDAAAWLHEYFDRQSAPVISAMQTIAEVRESTLTIDAPDIAESLRLLRQYRTLTEIEP